MMWCLVPSSFLNFRLCILVSYKCLWLLYTTASRVIDMVGLNNTMFAPEPFLIFLVRPFVFFVVVLDTGPVIIYRSGVEIDIMCRGSINSLYFRQQV